MPQDDPVSIRAAADSLLQCLQALAQEACHLRMSRTSLALQKAIRACRSEQARPRGPRISRRQLMLH